MGLEAAVEKPVCARAAKAGWLVRKLQWVGRIGAPDRFFAKAGRIVLIEFKAPGEKPRLSQTLEHDALRASGVEVYCIDNVAEALRILEIA